MDTLSVRIKYRPVRIGWCIRDGDIAELRKALRLTHTMWGGRFNPIIPVDNFEYGEQLVKVFRVDVLVSPSDDEAIKSFTDRFPYLPNPFFPPVLFVKEDSGKTYSTVVDLYHPIRRLYEEHFKNRSTVVFRASLYEWNDDDPLRDVLLATFGGFPPVSETGTDYGGLIEKHLAAEKLNLFGLTLPSDSFKKATPNWVCCFDLEGHYSVINYWDNPGFYIGDARDFTDVVNFWNIRATGTDLLFYDTMYSDRLNAVRDEFVKVLKARPKTHRSFDTDVAVWSKSKLDTLDLSGFGTVPTRCLIGLGTWNGLNIKAPIFHFGGKSVLAAVGSSYGKTRISFPLPEKPVFEEVKLSSQHLVVSISYGIGLYGNERATLMTPNLSELNEYYGRNHFFHWDKARVEPEGIGIIIDAWDSDLGLNALDVTSLIAKVFEIAGIRAQTSKPGLIASRLIQQLGGIQGCRVLKIAGVRDLIERYKPDQSFTNSAAKQIIGRVDPTNGRTNFSEYEGLFLEARPWDTKLKPEDAFAYLLKHGAFRVGLEFQCPNCRLDFWLPLDEAKTETTCEYCGQDFDVTTQLRDRDWRYRRSGLFGKDNKQEGSIPTALTLQQMETVLHHHRVLYTTAMEIEPVGASVSRCETDFVILTQQTIDHKVQVAIGECKNRGEISDDDVLKLRMVAEALEKKGIRVFVVFSKLADFSTSELERCKAVNSKYVTRLILLTARELEPRHLYKTTAREFDIREHAISFEDMTQTTQTVFYDQRRKPQA